MKQNQDRTDPVILIGVAILGFFVLKALTTPNQRRVVSGPRRQLALPEPGRDYLVLYSGHGSDFRFGNLDGGTTAPSEPFKTLSEAVADARKWELTADAIGGRAKIQNMRTGEQFDPFSISVQ